MSKCPYCGGELKIVGVRGRPRLDPTVSNVGRNPVTAFEMSTFLGDGADTLTRLPSPGTTVQPPAASGLSDERRVSTRQPARAPSVESDVKVPLLQGVVTGALFCACVTAGWLALEWPKPGLATAASFLGATTTEWLRGRAELRDLMWRVERFLDRDLDQDGAVGPPSPPAGPTSRVIIRPRHQVPASWSELPAANQVEDVYFFAKTVWQRQLAGLANGQKALRGLALPSGFELTDSLHAEILGLLDQAGVLRKKGAAWELAAPPAAVRKLVSAEEWP